MCSCFLGCQNHCTCSCHGRRSPLRLRFVATPSVERCDACNGERFLTVTTVEMVTSADGMSGGQYAYHRLVPCGRCSGRGQIEVSA